MLCWVYAHETLVAGLMAALAALGTIWIINKQIKQADLSHREQIKQADLLHKEERLRRLEAARSVMPLALSKMCGYSMACILYAKSYWQEVPDREQPLISDDVISVLRDVVETADDDIRIAVRSLISRYQIQAAMLRDLAPEPRKLVAFGLDESIADAIIDATKLHAHASNFFKYARFDSEAVPLDPTDDAVESQLRFWGLNEDIEPSVWSRMKDPV
ncbi:hypothetical protein SAMN02744133_11186 [Thalassospira xiamenensis M-5 = DSM 17429]|nr:hypothetical protein SAMN02744133_11186 [Thalassospira xiamenensis M-5 = DSM 17429]